MKRVVQVLLVLLGMMVFGVTASAATLPSTWYTVQNGDTYFKPFATSLCSDEQKAFMEEWTASNYNLFYIDKYNFLYFVVYPPGTYKAEKTKIGSEYRLAIKPIAGRYMRYKYDSGRFIPAEAGTYAKPNAFSEYVVTGTVFKTCNIVPNSTTKPYFYTYTGTLHLEDDSGILSPRSEYELRIKYQYADGTQAAAEHVESLLEGVSYNVQSPSIAGYTPDKATVSGTMSDAPVSVTVTYRPINYNLTINYQYAGGGAAAPTHHQQLIIGDNYNVTSPTITGYRADKATVTGTMSASDVTVTVTYSPLKYTLMVRYVYEDGSIAHSMYTADYVMGAQYSITSPTIAGYTPDRATVSGTMPAESVVLIVTYIEDPPPSYTLTIQYRYADGRAAAADHVESLVEGTSYKVTSPTITGYTADQTMVSGTMPGHDLTVTYREDVPELYQLCVQFLRDDGSAVASEYTEQLEAGASYRVEPPPIAGYTPDRSMVTGTMPASDLTVAVTYTKDAEPPPIDPPDPPDPPEPPPVNPPGSEMPDGKIFDYDMFAAFFDFVRDNGGTVITFYIKGFLLVSGILGAVTIVRKVILAAVGLGSQDDEPPTMR